MEHDALGTPYKNTSTSLVLFAADQVLYLPNSDHLPATMDRQIESLNRKSSLLMDNARSFHQRVFALRPTLTIKPTTFWVAVLRAAVKVSSNVTEDDFLWIKCHGEIKASVIRAQYEQKNPSDGKIMLKLGTLLSGDETMRSLDHFKDQLVVLEVVKASEPSLQSIRGRSPLRPTTAQLKSPPPHVQTNPTLKNQSNTISGTTFSSGIPKIAGQDENHNPQPALQPAALSSPPDPAVVSPASVIPNLGLSTVSPVVVMRPDWATSKGFSLYEEKTTEKMAAKWSHLNCGKRYLTLPMLSLLTSCPLQLKSRT